PSTGPGPAWWWRWTRRAATSPASPPPPAARRAAKPRWGGSGEAALRAAVPVVARARGAEVNSDPANPVIGVRSFGSDADLVARHAAGFVAGLQAAGGAACAKDFPGPRGVAARSHL